MNNPEPPEELVNKKFDFVGIHFDSEVDLNHPKTLSMPYSNGSWVPSKQTFIEDLDIVFWVFLDNADEDRVHHKVLFNVSARINPGEFLGDPAPAKNGSHKLNGLYQAMFNIDINPKGLDESAITWAASAPQSVNQEITQTESVTDSFSFDIGYKVAKVSRSWTYQFGRSYAVSNGIWLKQAWVKKWVGNFGKSCLGMGSLAAKTSTTLKCLICHGIALNFLRRAYGKQRGK